VNPKILTLFPHANRSFLTLNPQTDCPLPPSKPQPIAQNALGAEGKRAVEVHGRIGVCYTAFVVRPYDWDNLAGATKQLGDLLTKSTLLPNDDPHTIEVSWKQRKVNSYAEEKIEIEITYP
jgi:hypothetical protein